MQSKGILTWILNKLRKEIKKDLHFDAKTQKQLVYAVQKTTNSLEYKPVEPVPDFFESDVVEVEVIEQVSADFKRIY